MGRNRRHALRMIQQDAQADARALDGQPFTGATVAPALGNPLARIHTLARVAESLLPEDENREEIEQTPVDVAPSAVGGSDA